MSPKKVELAQFQAAFIAEARELIEGFEASVIHLEDNPDDSEAIHAVFRNAHSIKGAAASAGLTGLTAFTHALETMLDVWRAGQLTPTAEHFGVLYQSADMLTQLITDESPAVLAAAAEVSKTLGLLGGQPRHDDEHNGESSAPPAGPAQAATARRIRVYVHLETDAYQWGGDPLLAIRELLELAESGTVTVDERRLPDLQVIAPEEAFFDYSLDLQVGPAVTPARIEEAFAFFSDVAQVQVQAVEEQEAHGETIDPTPQTQATEQAKPLAAGGAAQQGAAAHRAGEPTTIRVATEKIDRVIDLVGELVIAHSAVRELTRDHNPQHAMALTEAVLVAERHLRELQERVMAVRMIPVSTVFSRLPRAVKDAARKLGKEVRLVTEGADTELDKTLIEKLADPLTHLVRNAVDHGIEAPDDRERLGKPRLANLTVRSYARSGSVYVEVQDDGRGIDTNRVRETAIKRGLIAVDTQLSEQEVLMLLCRPGFSTKTEVSDVSGRGVGLDVVQKNVESLNGALDIHSTAGRGTRFTLRLPLTLTIVDGLLLSTSRCTCVLPLTDVAFSLRIIPSQVRDVVGAGYVLDLPNETLPILDLCDVLGLPPADKPADLAVVVHTGSMRFALRVEALLGQAQTVVKSLETHYRRLPGIMGATILGDGRVALILDGLGLATAAGLGRSHRDNSYHGGSEMARGTCSLPH